MFSQSEFLPIPNKTVKWQRQNAAEGLNRTKGWWHTAMYAYVYSAQTICCLYVEAAKYGIASQQKFSGAGYWLFKTNPSEEGQAV